MPTTCAEPLVSPADARNRADLLLAARGDADAQLRLAIEARRLVVSGEADDIIGSIDGVNYARMAATQGKPDALMVLAEHCAHLATVYGECGETVCSEDWHGQAFATLELAAENMPASCDAERADLMQALNELADQASPAIMEFAKLWRALWAPAFAPQAVA